MANDNIYLVGHTGFVGSNLCRVKSFSKIANSKNVESMYGDAPDILIYAGVTGTKWYANEHEEEDFAVIQGAIKNISNINPKKLILISTVDVYDRLKGATEDYISNGYLHIYGKNRLYLEKWVKQNTDDYHIVRLPAIYGEGLKKNFIYDLIHFVPLELKPAAYDAVNREYFEIYQKSLDLFYDKVKGGNRVLKNSADVKYNVLLKQQFSQMKHNSLMFTNDQSEYQFYNLQYLWNDLCKIVENNITVMNLVTEPVSAREVYQYVYNKEFSNSGCSPIKYNLLTKYADLFEGKQGYILNKCQVLEDLKMFVDKT